MSWRLNNPLDIFGFPDPNSYSYYGSGRRYPLCNFPFVVSLAVYDLNMGKKGGWYSAVKRALTSDHKSKKDQKSKKSKKKWLGHHGHADQGLDNGESALDMAETPPSPPTLPTPSRSCLSGDLKRWPESEEDGPADRVLYNEETALVMAARPPTPPPLPPPPRFGISGDLKQKHDEDEQSEYMALSTVEEAEAAVVAAQTAAEVFRLTCITRFPGKPKEEAAAIMIKSAFRGYKARKALRALRGMVRLKALIQGQSVKRQSSTTLQCMQTLARVQSQVRARRIRMSEENRAFQRQLQQQQEKKEQNKSKFGDGWSNSTQSREQMEKKLVHRQEAALRRERALAYSFATRQAMKNSRSQNTTSMDPTMPSWGWSWLERWMAARPWETRTAGDCNDQATIKGPVNRTTAPTNTNKPSPTVQKPRKPQNSSNAPSAPSTKVGGRSFSLSESNCSSGDEDSRSIFSMQSEQPNFRRHSTGPSSVKVDESLANNPPVLSHKAPTKSAKVGSQSSSPSGPERNSSALEKGMGSVVAGPSAKKHIPLQVSPAGNRRHSGPSKVNVRNLKSISNNA